MIYSKKKQEPFYIDATHMLLGARLRHVWEQGDQT